MSPLFPILLALAIGSSACGDSKKSPTADRVTSVKDASPTTTAATSPAVSTHAGPAITVADEWTQCTTAADCTRIFSPCGTRSVIVNTDSAMAAGDAFRSACEGKTGIGIVGTDATFDCLEGRCRIGATRHADPRIAHGMAGAHKPAKGPFVAVGKGTTGPAYSLPPFRRAFRKGVPGLTDCYARSLSKAPTLAGSIVFTGTVDAKGRAAGVKSESKLPRALVRCMTVQVKKLALPVPTKAPATFTMPLELTP